MVTLVFALQVIENCPVKKIISEQSSISGTPKITGVLTPYGLIKTNVVVNCSGKHYSLQCMTHVRDFNYVGCVSIIKKTYMATLY